MQHGLSALKMKLIAMIAALVVAFSLGLVSQAGATGSAGISDLFATSAKVAKTKKTKKKRSKNAKSRIARNGNGRTNASTAKGGRYVAQSDLESDLESETESDLDGELGSDLGSSEPMGGEPIAPESAPAMGDEVQITDIQYDAKQNGGTVIISTTGAATYRTREVPESNQVVIEIANAKLPEKLKRPFNTKDFKQATVSITPYQDPSSNTSRIVLQFRQPRTVDVRQNGRVLTIVPNTGAAGTKTQAAANGSGGGDSPEQSPQSDDFGEDSGSDVAGDSPVEPEDYGMDAPEPTEPTYVEGARTQQRSAPRESMVTSSGAKIGGGGGKIMPTSTLEEERVGQIRFYGRPISVEVRDTPVRDVLTLISDQSGANIVMSDDISGAITIKLRQVPWDQALSIVMKTRGLGYIRNGGVLRIAPIRQLQAEAEEARRIIEAQEATLPLRVRVIPVSFAQVSTLATQIRNTLQGIQTTGTTAPGATGRGRIEADSRTSSLVVTDTDDNIKRIEQLVKALDTPPLQVLIEGKIVEAREEAGKNFGINWGYQGQDLGFAGGTLSHSARITPTMPPSNTDIDLRLGTLDFLGDLDAKLALFERESTAKIISSPRVVTMNAQPATIEQAIQIPVPKTAITPGAPAVTTIEYKSIPTSLKVTPQITSGGDVLMQISFRREFAGQPAGGNVPVETRDVNTNVMVKNGQTTVIGGIYQSDQTESENGTPYLRRIPVLGWLFKTVEKTNLRNELLVFITPRILNADRTLPRNSSVQ